MKKRTDFHKIIIGRAEVLTFTQPSIEHVPAKVDTGAYRSAVHASNISLSKDGKTLSFTLLGDHPVCGALAQEVSVTDFKQVKIANSFGHKELRYEVKLPVKLGNRSFVSHFSLADRSKKVYPILLGRKLLNDRFVVDTSQTSINRIELKQQYGISFPTDEEEGREE